MQRSLAPAGSPGEVRPRGSGGSTSSRARPRSPAFLQESPAEPTAEAAKGLCFGCAPGARTDCWKCSRSRGSRPKLGTIVVTPRQQRQQPNSERGVSRHERLVRPARPHRKSQGKAYGEDRHAHDDHRAGQRCGSDRPRPATSGTASTGKPQATTPSTVTNRDASRPSTISASERSVTIIRVNPPRILSWQMAPAVTTPGRLPELERSALPP